MLIIDTVHLYPIFMLWLESIIFWELILFHFNKNDFNWYANEFYFLEIIYIKNDDFDLFVNEFFYLKYIKKYIELI